MLRRCRVEFTCALQGNRPGTTRDIQAVRIPARGTSEFAPIVQARVLQARLPLDSPPRRLKRFHSPELPPPDAVSRLSQMAISPGLKVGSSCQRRYSLKLFPLMAWSAHHGAVSRSACKPAIKVIVFQWPPVQHPGNVHHPKHGHSAWP
jgi:hypothetical protein